MNKTSQSTSKLMRTGEQNELKKIGIIGAMELEVETLK